ncbi:MFS transporter [Actinokineospora fastidiosa]|uniref:MFS transporter n=1 Tax=Actinokineospora fastidiosa TaxID=1816 RepID=A0A918GS75_9PSEU|nr:MFS transporter [Actinokineospora fastidiosa]GGS58619.1 MFS transporter [Actinokineospora fastidiosa]
MTVPLRRNRDYTLLWVGQACAEVGFSASLIAFPLLVLAVTGSAVASGVVLAADAVAQFVVGLPGGALADRWDRRRVMLACEGVQAAALASLVAVLLLDAVVLPHLVLVAVVLGACRALFEPAEDASIAAIVPDDQLATAIALNSARSSIGQLAGTALGGVLFAIARWVPFLLDLITHVIAFTALLFLRLPPRRVERAPLRGLGREVRDGIRWVARHPEIRVTTLCAVVLNLFFSAFYLIVIVLADQRGVPAGEIGIMAAMLGAGGLLGALIAPALHRALRPHIAIAAVFWALTALAPLTLLVPGGYLMGAVFAAMALFAPTANTTITTHQLLLTPDEMRGRLSGVMNVAVGAAAAIGPALGGVLAETLTARHAVVVCVIGMAVVTLFVTVNPTLRRYPGRAHQREEVQL